MNKIVSKQRYTRNQLFVQLGLVTVLTTALIGGFAITNAYGQAQSNTIRVSLPIETVAIPVCGVEPVSFSGIFNFVVHETIRPNGESAFIFSHMNYQKITATSESGEIFKVHQVDNDRVSTIQTGDNEFILRTNGIAIDTGQGINGPNSLVQIVLHFIVHPDGETTGEVEDIDVKCVGGDDGVSIIESILDNL